MEEKTVNSNIWLYVVLGFIAGILIGGGITLALRGGSTPGDTISLYPPKSSAVGNDWLIKIDDYAVTKSEFEEGYKYFMSQIPEQQRASLPPDTKRLFFENLLSQYIINLKALKEGLPKTREGQLLLRTAIRQAIYQIYLTKNIPQDKSIFMPSQIEINDYYMRNKAQFDKLGMKSDQIKQYAIQELSQQKMQMWVQGFVAQAKESFKVERNNDQLEQVGISVQQNAPVVLPPATNEGGQKLQQK